MKDVLTVLLTNGAIYYCSIILPLIFFNPRHFNLLNALAGKKVYCRRDAIDLPKFISAFAIRRRYKYV